MKKEDHYDLLPHFLAWIITTAINVVAAIMGWLIAASILAHWYMFLFVVIFIFTCVKCALKNARQ